MFKFFKSFWLEKYQSKGMTADNQLKSKSLHQIQVNEYLFTYKEYTSRTPLMSLLVVEDFKNCK